MHISCKLMCDNCASPVKRVHIIEGVVVVADALTTAHVKYVFFFIEFYGYFFFRRSLFERAC